MTSKIALEIVDGDKIEIKRGSESLWVDFITPTKALLYHFSGDEFENVAMVPLDALEEFTMAYLRMKRWLPPA